VVKVTYIEANGTEHVVEVRCGLSVMQGARQNGVPGIDADCGGHCNCGTCHVYVDAAWKEKTGARRDLEDATLDNAYDVGETSRLSCQIKMTDDLDGLIVRLPARQR
jgi:2Fe-2S ferredoxin